MPRISFTTYCERRAKLTQAWQTYRSAFLDLSPQEQWLLHDYYRFTGPLTQSQLQQHWSALHDKRSSLPQRAGKAYAIFEKAIANSSLPVESQSAQSVQVHGKKRKRAVNYKVSSIVRSEPDMRKLAKALLSVVRQEAAVLAKGDGERIIQSNEQKTTR